MSKRVISFFYKLTDTKGKVIDQSEDGQPLAFLEGTGQIIPGLEEVLVTLKEGDTRVVDVKAEDAYGMREESLVVRVPMADFPKKNVQLGDVFQSQAEESSEPVLFTVIKVDDSVVTLDGNHPLAGQDLKFDIKMGAIRSATPQELEHGHAHGAGGHHH